MGPLVLLLALAGGGFVFLGSHVPKPAAQAAQHTAAASNARSTAPPGVQLPGRIIGTPHVRSEPASTASILQDLQSGQNVQVSACSNACSFYLVATTGHSPQGWVSSAFVELQGDEQKLPVAR
jgi:SH3 domain-containing protein